MLEIKPGESRKDYMNRCIPYVIKEEGLTQEQAAGKCGGMYDNAKKSEFDANLKKALDIVIPYVQTKINILEKEQLVGQYVQEIADIRKARTVEGYESPEPGDLPEEKAKVLAQVYASCRKDGGEKEKCSKIAWAAVNRMKG
jgi:hypothetical protein